MDGAEAVGATVLVCREGEVGMRVGEEDPRMGFKTTLSPQSQFRHT